MNAKTALPLLALAALFASVGTGIAAQSAKTPTPPASNTCPYAARMGAQMQRMQSMHRAMINASTPADRAKLMNRQMRVMQQSMGMMRGMGGPGMGGSMRMRGGMGPGMGMRGNGAGTCMNQRLGMMEMMMQMMMDRMSGPSQPK